MCQRVLSASDPEPAVGSVVLDRFGTAWQRIVDEEDGIFWLSTSWDRIYQWSSFGVLGHGPVTLIHDSGKGA